MASAIDDTKPVTGTPTTQSVRDNFAAAKSEITALQATVPTWTVGSVPFATSTTALGQDNANLAWDNTNKRLGIGTTAPGSKLEAVSATHVGDPGFAAQLAATDTSPNAIGNGGWINLRGVYTGTTTTDFAAIAARKVTATAGEYHANLNFYARQNGSGTWTPGSPQLMIEGQTGTVAVGNGAPGGVGGGLVVGGPTGGAIGAGKINAVEVRAANVVLTSDADLKRDIEPLGAALPLVAAVAPRTFRWKPLVELDPVEVDGEMMIPPGGPADFTEKINRGFLAQEVAEAFHTKAEEGIDLGGMVAILWQAVRELSDRVNELEGDKPAPRH